MNQNILNNHYLLYYLLMIHILIMDLQQIILPNVLLNVMEIINIIL